MKNSIKEIRNWAIELHGEQKYGIHDYVYHLDLVYDMAVHFKMNEDYLIASYLHDVIEDCGVSKDVIELRTNKHISNMVWAVSGFGDNRKEKKEDMIKKMLEYPDSIDLKMIDRYVNIEQSKLNNSRLYQMYVKEMNDYKDVFKLGNPKIYEKILELTGLRNDIKIFKPKFN